MIHPFMQTVCANWGNFIFEGTPPLQPLPTNMINSLMKTSYPPKGACQSHGTFEVLSTLLRGSRSLPCKVRNILENLIGRLALCS